ncbi:hypothetical protein [Lactobacillus sp. ESL0225]|uniref:hypothetical protein n=1 Tax=Lactobacillus sp. ESL0225 TaxID=2069351 RepID=UPI000EFB975F|nr:hypothetical protein [Lactobacillus sp. ESL0225]RMC47728.1 hypothetical protein F5ESL0225_08185 [Lactobacillus sp. ESL0225]
MQKAYIKEIQNYEMLTNWREPANYNALQKIINMDDKKKFTFRQKARTSLVDATNMISLRKLLGAKTPGSVAISAGKPWMWTLKSHKTKLNTLQVLAAVLPEGDLIPFLQSFCGLDYTNSDFASREIVKDNLFKLERKNTHMKGKALKSVFWAGTPKSDLRKSSDDLLTVARAICKVSYAKLYTRGLLTDSANELIDRTITLTNFSIKELKKAITPTMSMDKIAHCLGIFLLAGWLKRIPEKYTVSGIMTLNEKKGSSQIKKAKNGYTLAPSIYMMQPLDAIDWQSLLDTITLDTTASVRSDLVKYWLGEDYAKQFINHNKQAITTEELAAITKVKNNLEATPNKTVPKKELAKMLQRANMHMQGNTALQHLKDLLIWKQFDLIEINSKLANLLGFKTEKRTLKDKVIVNATAYWARKSY